MNHAFLQRGNEDERFTEAIEYLKSCESTEEIGEFLDIYVGKLQRKVRTLHEIKALLGHVHPKEKAILAINQHPII